MPRRAVESTAAFGARVFAGPKHNGAKKAGTVCLLWSVKNLLHLMGIFREISHVIEKVISIGIQHLVENAFLHPKRWRGIATRCATPRLLLLQLFNSMHCTLVGYFALTIVDTL